MIEAFLEVFVIGVATPLTAACALPLYPGFVAYLASESRGNRRLSPTLLGVIVTLGVVSFMGLVGAVFSYLLGVSLTLVVEYVSPAAFAVLLVVSVALLFDLRFDDYVPTVDPPQSRFPSLTAFGYGFFFGAIVLPCNPGFIALFFARAPVLFATPAQSMLGFLTFGLGMGAPLLGFATVSQGLGQRATRWLAQHASTINRVAGAIMLVVSVYYLVIVFDVLGIAPLLKSVSGVVGGAVF
jgi:cytochrome c-type biogenesis protein